MVPGVFPKLLRSFSHSESYRFNIFNSFALLTKFVVSRTKKIEHMFVRSFFIAFRCTISSASGTHMLRHILCTQKVPVNGQIFLRATVRGREFAVANYSNSSCSACSSEIAASKI